jgi:chitinase
VKLRVDKNNKVVCDGLVDVGNVPTITLVGDKDITIAKGSNFADPGATAKDKEDGNLTKKVKISGLVNTSVPGKYSLVYYVEDSMHNISSVERRVTVK